MQLPANRRVKVTVNGKSYTVEVGDLNSSPIKVLVNGRPCLVNISAADIEVVPADASAASPEKATREPSGPAGPMVNAVKAPMPGHILDIAVKPGDTVAFRQQLCTLEAMKMKNAIRSPKDGAIATVEVTEGQTVAHNDVLFTFK